MVISEGMVSRKEAAIQLKECPVCHAQCFSDMEVCYGCLNAFTPRNKETRLDESVPLVSFDASQSQVEHVPQSLSADDIDRLVAQEEAYTVQAVPGSKSVSVSPVMRDKSIRTKTSAQKEDALNGDVPSVDTGISTGSGTLVSQKDEYKRIASPMRLTDLLEIVISVRIAQDAKTRCEDRLRASVCPETLEQDEL